MSSLGPPLQSAEGACRAIGEAIACAWSKHLEILEACLSSTVLLLEALGSESLAEDNDLEEDIVPGVEYQS